MGVSAEIVEYLFGATERRLGVDHPFALAQRRQEGSKSGLLLQRSDLAEKLEFAFPKSLFKRFQKETAEQARKNAHRQKEARAAPEPTVVIGRKSTPGNYAVNVRVMAPTLTIP